MSELIVRRAVCPAGLFPAKAETWSQPLKILGALYSAGSAEDLINCNLVQTLPEANSLFYVENMLGASAMIGIAAAWALAEIP